MEVSKKHVVDAGEQGADGLYDYYYAYRLFTFRNGDTALIARSYDDQPQKVHFLRKEVGDLNQFVSDEDISGPLFIEACSYLKEIEGMSVIEVLKKGGYQKVQFK